MIHSLFKNKVRLDKEAHRYYDESEFEYMSFSRLFTYLSPKFDAQNISRHVSRRDNVSQEDVLKKWQGTADDGTHIDAALKLYAKSGEILEENRSLERLIKAVSEKYKDYYAIYSDIIVYDEKYRVAGEIDRLALTANRRDSSFHISDFKRMPVISQEPKGQKWLNYPFDHFCNHKYNKISWQLSFYAHLFSELTGRKCERLFIDQIIPVMDGDKLIEYRNRIIPVAYLKSDVIRFLDHFQNRIIKDLEPVKTIEPTEEF